MKDKLFVISLGGSLIVPDQIDSDFLKNFKKLIDSFLKKGCKFVIISGGGKTCRNYVQAAKNVLKLSDDDCDWLGIHSTRLNAHLLRTIFYKNASPVIVTHPLEKFVFNGQILIAAGWKPGRSTDYIAVMLAKKLKAKKIINLSNIDYAYDKDPRKHKDAKPIMEASWKEFRKILPKKWSPASNSPFDPVASAEAEKSKLEVVIMNGKNLENLKNYLLDKDFIGTKIT